MERSILYERAWRSKASLAVEKGSLTFTYHNRTDFQLDFPDSLHSKLGGESTQQRLLCVKIYLCCDLCMKKLCLENINAVVTLLDGNGCGSHLFSGTKFYVSGKAPKMLSLSPGKILILTYYIFYIAAFLCVQPEMFLAWVNEVFRWQHPIIYTAPYPLVSLLWCN